MGNINPPLCSFFPSPSTESQSARWLRAGALEAPERMGLWVLSPHPLFFVAFFWRAEIRTHPSQEGGEKQGG